MTNAVQVLPEDTAFEVLKRIFVNGTKDQIVQIAMLCWGLWNRRNKWVWNKINISSFGVQSEARNMLYEWRRAMQEKCKYVPVVQSSSRQWRPPPSGYVKVNIDAATFTGTKHIGVGSVVRDEHGRFLRARGQKIEADMHPREAEAVSLKEALSWMMEEGFQNCIFETDAKSLVDACKGSNGRGYFHTIVSDCLDLFKHFNDVLIQFVHRSVNGVAHVLARATHFMSDTQEWIDTAPAFMLDALSFDSI